MIKAPRFPPLYFIFIVVIFCADSRQTNAQSFPQKRTSRCLDRYSSEHRLAIPKRFDHAAQQEEYVTLLNLKSVGMNAVIVQVRPSADGRHPSSYEPWTEYLSGEQGKAPEPYYNPLEFMIRQAKQRGLEFHACSIRIVRV